MGGLGVKVQHFPLTLLVVLTTLTLPCERDSAVFTALHYCGFCCRNFSTWWAIIMGKHKDFKEIPDLDYC